MGGSSVEEAAEQARSVAMQLLADHLRQAIPATLIVRIETPGKHAFVMQSTRVPFNLESAGAAGGLYFDSDGNTAAS
ncbi:MAG: hypothetical protein ABR508_09650 [Candidatus Baltobacteraceae bacterium]